ncbi:nucleoside transporter [Catalinimonas alkaloidigena]|uniref:nucleoside permease n=1 Tax=Catalinimonas alkaloidigena TaxID=1075417 RepID=UPI002405F585|nr:nucleoside permease [Catalinimonas alkaloidigena]MDF9795481.1 nucleoside transporter [Catalinimonas alkaloidigena]
MTIKTRLQLSGMMFLQFFVWGAWYVTLGTYLGVTLKFEGSQIGLAYSAFAIAAMISPFFVGMVADRFFPTERVLAVLHLIGAALLYWLAQIEDFSLFYPVIIAYTLCFMPTIALTNSLSFENMENPGEQFPAIRVVGTISWIIVGLIVGYLDIEALNTPILLASASSVVMGLYCFTLPHTPPKSKGQKASVKDILGLDALKLMKDRSFSVLFIASLLICIPLSFYYSFANLFLNDLGVENAAGKMTMGQGSEILFLLLMPFFFKRFGYKIMLMVGMAAWGARYALFMFGNPTELVWMLYGGIILHGICYDFFFVTGQIYVDERAPKAVKNAAQGLITFATYGVGMFIGSWLSGIIVEANTIVSDDVNEYLWDKIWLVPAVLSVIVLVLFTIFFREKKEIKKPGETTDDATAEGIAETKAV